MKILRVEASAKLHGGSLELEDHHPGLGAGIAIERGVRAEAAKGAGVQGAGAGAAATPVADPAA